MSSESPPRKSPSKGKKWAHLKPALPDVSELAQISELSCGCRCESCIDYFKKCIVMRDELYAAQCALRDEKTAMQETLDMVKVYEKENAQKQRDKDLSLVAGKEKTKIMVAEIENERRIHLETVYKLHKAEEDNRHLESGNSRNSVAVAQMSQKVEKLQLEKLSLAEQLQSLTKANAAALLELQRYERELARAEELNNHLRCQLADIDKVSGGQLQRAMHQHLSGRPGSLMAPTYAAGGGHSQSSFVYQDSNLNSNSYGNLNSSVNGSVSRTRQIQSDSLARSSSSPAPIPGAITAAARRSNAKAAGRNAGSQQYSDNLSTSVESTDSSGRPPTLLMQYAKGYK